MKLENSYLILHAYSILKILYASQNFILDLSFNKKDFLVNRLESDKVNGLPKSESASSTNTIPSMSIRRGLPVEEQTCNLEESAQIYAPL